jgi:hypothetical protein
MKMTKNISYQEKDICTYIQYKCTIPVVYSIFFSALSLLSFDNDRLDHMKADQKLSFFSHILWYHMVMSEKKSYLSMSYMCIGSILGPAGRE